MKYSFAIAAALLVITLSPLQANGDGIEVGNWPIPYPVVGSVSVLNLPDIMTVQASTGTNVMVQNFTITGSTVAGQTVASYVVPIARTFFLQYAEAESYYLNFTTSVSNFGPAYLSVNGVHGYTTQMAGAGISRTGLITFNPPLAFAGNTTISWLVTPAAGTATVWYGNIGGYYR